MIQLNQVAQIVRDLIGNEYLYFDTAVQVKMTPHTPPINIWAICASPAGNVYVMDSNEQWHQLHEKDAPVIATIYQRLSIVSLNYKKAS